MSKSVVLFLCTGNSCRSQMAEGWAHHLLGDHLTACSAGIETHGLNPRAVQVMKEAGVDISNQCSQHIDEFDGQPIDLVVTVCSHADANCPVIPGARKVIHHGFDDPPKLTAEMQDEEEILKVYRRVRDDIRAFVENVLPQQI